MSSHRWISLIIINNIIEGKLSTSFISEVCIKLLALLVNQYTREVALSFKNLDESSTSFMLVELTCTAGAFVAILIYFRAGIYIVCGASRNSVTSSPFARLSASAPCVPRDGRWRSCHQIGMVTSRIEANTTYTLG